jgi:uncharacterized protein involved in response to NO
MSVWHAHEMIMDYAAATVAGFLQTVIANWAGRMPLQREPLAALVLLWVTRRFSLSTDAVAGVSSPRR